MSSYPLSDARVKELYASFREREVYPEWRERYRAALDRFAAFDSRALASPAIQAELWSARAMFTAGPGDSLDVQGAYTDSEIVRRIVGLREHDWPSEDVRRAEALEAMYGELLALVSPAHSKRRPWAKLARVFAALLPHDTHCALSGEVRGRVSHLLLGSNDQSALRSLVLARARLRRLLGAESGFDEDVARSTFCWWLHENFVAILKGEEANGLASPPVREERMERPPITILPGPRLRRGFPAFEGYAVTVRLIVEAAQGGATPDDVVEALRNSPGYESMAPAHARRIFSFVRYLHMLRHEGGLWFPSKDGELLLDDARYDALVERMLCETFGLAHYLRFLADERVMARGEACTKLRRLYPAWTTDRAPQSVIRWALSLGLVRLRVDNRAELTEYGDEWVARLPAVLSVPPLLTAIDEVGVDDAFADDEVERVGPPARTSSIATPEELRTVALAAVADGIRTAAPDIVVDPGILRVLHLAWHSNPSKRFVILSGLSGTGKTIILKLYAEAYCRHLQIDPRRHLVIAPVSPDWRDPSGLIGYFNALHADPTYRAEPALRLILDAHENPGLPYFLVLDEMNLARVEHYFAPFLSAMETGGEINLHAHDEPINEVPPSIRWPRNLFIAGTVNMDETTFSISDKVLDRAFTLEFWNVDLPAFFARRAELSTTARHQGAEDVLLDLHAILKTIRRHFGYRTAREVLALLDAAAREGFTGAVLDDCLDQAVFSKILPRIRGEESSQLRTVLDGAVKRCKAAGLQRSALKLEAMNDALAATGLTKFWA